MGKGGNKTQRIDITDNYNPQIVGRAAQKGTLFRYIPPIGVPIVFMKADEGFSTNWLAIGDFGSGIVELIDEVSAGPGIGTQAASLLSPAITNKTLVASADADELLISDASDAGNLKKATALDIAALSGITQLTTEVLAGPSKGVQVASLAPPAIANKTLVVPEILDQFLISDVSDGGALKKVTGQNIAKLGQRTIGFGFSDNSNPYLENAGTGYKVMAEFNFPGTTLMGPLTKIELVLGSDSAVQSCDAKIFDRTHGLTIVELTNFVSATRVITNLGALANVPTGPSVFEVQGKRNGGGARMQFSSVALFF